MRNPRSARQHTPRGLRGQRGAYAVEFALVFSVFFLVMYGVFTFGLIFAAQQSLNLAAQDGARAALRWQAGEPGASIPARAGQAEAVARQRIRWLARVGGNAVSVTVCRTEDGAKVQLNGAGGAGCGAQLLQEGQLEVLVRYDYRAAPLMPGLLGPLAVVTPASLAGRATVCLGSTRGFAGACRDGAA